MRIDIKLDDEIEETHLLITARKFDDELQSMVNYLRQLEKSPSNIIRGWQDDKVLLIKPEHVIKIYTENKQIFAVTATQTVKIKERLYTLEEQLTPHSFLRVSQSELVNFAHVKELDLSFNGTIALLLTNQHKAFVSRRFIAKVKKYIDL